MHLKRAVGVAAVLSTALALALPGVAAADADGPVFTVINTSETLPDGVYFRSSASMSSAQTVTSLGVYAGEQMQLQCYSGVRQSGRTTTPFGTKSQTSVALQTTAPRTRGF